ncbi:Regucalcin [Diplodia seriata]|uniref:Regucalcin n=1 Tax=Diplodia seriata TaxID=420778 RepID=A0A1S8B8U7_9PEZI|nr:Regucalcin [Diplodia seriata]
MPPNLPPALAAAVAEAARSTPDWPFNWPDFPKRTATTSPDPGPAPSRRPNNRSDDQNRPENEEEEEEDRASTPSPQPPPTMPPPNPGQGKPQRRIPPAPSTAPRLTDLTATPPFHRCTPPMLLGEGPIYRASDSTLHWFSCLPDTSTTPPTPPSLHILRVDPLTGRALVRDSHADEEGGNYRVLPLAESVTVAAFRKGRDKGYVCAYYAGIAWMDEGTGALEVVREMVGEGERGARRMNDGGCDARGRFWVAEIDLVAAGRYGGMRREGGGSFRERDEGEGEEAKGRLWRFDADGSLHEMLAGGLVCGNGLAWSPDDGVMYLNDSVRGLVYAFDFDVERGEIANKRVLVDRRDSYGEPDGMVTDTEGNLWVAVYASDRIMVFSPQGEHLRDVLLPARNPACTTWGGKDFDILYTATGKDRANESDEKDEGGHMFMFKPGGGVKGFAKHVFAG